MKEERLPRRDWIVLPMLGLLTISLLLGSTELIARHFFFNSGSSVENCLIKDDPLTGFRAIPNSVCRAREFESPWIEYRFNRCGQRADTECGPTPPGSYRIVLAGSSTAMGYQVQADQGLAELLPSELTRRTGHKIDVYDEAMMSEYPATVALRIKDLIAAKPNLILWVLTSWDIEHPSEILPVVPKANGNRAPFGGTKQRLERALAEKSPFQTVGDILDTFHDVFAASRTKFLLQHFLYMSPSQYIVASLSHGGGTQESLRDRLSAEWQDHLLQFDKSYAEVQQRATKAGVPLVVVLVPGRVQAAMISAGQWPAGYDPYGLDNELHRIVEKHGGTYIPVLQDFRAIPNPEHDYYPVDSHPNASGHAILAGLLAKELTSGAIPTLGAPAQP